MAWWLLQQLAIVTLLIVIVHVISRAFALGPVVRHALWAVVLIKLITPPLVTWPWAVDAQTTRAAAMQPESIAARPAALFTMLVEAVSPDATVGAANPATVTTSRSRAQSWAALALVAWIAGSLTFGLVQLIRAFRLARLVRHSSRPSFEGLDALAREVATTVGVPAVPVQVVDGLSSPMIWATGRPRLLWPATLTALDAGAMRALLTHELAHVKRRDHWVAWLDLAAGLVWWWTPMYWHARRHIRQDAELACDAWAAEALHTDRRVYADALLALCTAPSKPTLPASALGIHTGDRRFLERRLEVIMRPRTPLHLSRLGVCTVAIAMLLALPAFAQRSASTPTPVSVLPHTDPTVRVPPVLAYEPGAATPRPVQRPAVIATVPEPGSQALPFNQPVMVAVPDTAAAAPQSLPAEAQALLNGYNETAAKAQRETAERLARERTALIEKLQKIQDAETKAGHLDEALAVRTRMRQLQAGAAFGTVQVMPVSAIVQPATTGLMGMRGQAGSTISLDVIGDTQGQVWGSGIYTDDSPVGAAAVHAGVLHAGERGTLRVTLLPGQSQYAGSSANGVSSAAYGPWPGSFRFDGTTNSGAIAASGASPGAVVREVTGTTEGSVWGTDIYTDDSSVAAAAVHQGLLKPGETGTVEITMLPGQASYSGSTRNGVTSTNWESWRGSFSLRRVVSPQSAAETQADKAALPPFHPNVVRAGPGITNPVVIKQVQPVYTPEAMRARIAGTAIVEILVDHTGKVTDARIMKSLDDQYGLDREALKAARQWIFRPAQNSHGEKIDVVVTLDLEFRLRTGTAEKG